MSADSHCLTTECMVCLINTHKQSTNGMEIATAFRAAHFQGWREKERERERERDTSVTLCTAQNPAAALLLCFSCHRRMAVIRETVPDYSLQSVSQENDMYITCTIWCMAPHCILPVSDLTKA